MIKTVKLQNYKQRSFNGILPGKTVNVDVANVDFYKRNGFVEVNEVFAEKEKAGISEAEQAKLDAKAQKDAEKLAKEQAKEQAKLDKEADKKKADAKKEKAGEESDIDALENEVKGTDVVAK